MYKRILLVMALSMILLFACDKKQNTQNTQNNEEKPKEVSEEKAIPGKLYSEPKSGDNWDYFTKAEQNWEKNIRVDKLRYDRTNIEGAIVNQSGMNIDSLTLVIRLTDKDENLITRKTISIVPGVDGKRIPDGYGKGFKYEMKIEGWDDEIVNIDGFIEFVRWGEKPSDN